MTAGEAQPKVSITLPPVDHGVKISFDESLHRRSSVFQDLLTVFRRNTIALRKGHLNAPHPPNSHDSDNASMPESDNILGKNKDDDDEDKPVTRQDLLNKIRQKKEVIGKLRMQPWSMGRKRRTLKLAQKYLEQHESKISKTHLYKEELRKALRLFKRSFDNFKTYLIPWEGKIKRIESHFGSVVSSYFTFLRWLIFVNIMVTLIIVCFVVVPEVLADAAADKERFNKTQSRKIISDTEKVHADKLAVVWHFDGYLRYSPLFYGYYSSEDMLNPKVHYRLPLAYFIVTLFIFGYSFFAILRKMAQNARMSKLSGSKADQYIFNWRVFTGWDYTIGNQDTASNTVMAEVIKLRESIAECRVGAKQGMRCVQILLRTIANVIIFSMLGFSIYCIVKAVDRSHTVQDEEQDLFTKNQVPSVVATITHVFPMIFDLVGKMENYHPRTALRAHLGRVLILYFVNYVTLIVALFEKLDTDLIHQANITDVHRFKRFAPINNWSKTPHNHENDSVFAAYLDQTAKTEKFNFTSVKPARQRTRTTRVLRTTPYTVQPQFGPVNVNSPNVLRHNATKAKPFAATRVGPQPLPVYTPPPRTFPLFNRGKVKQEYGGPDFPTKFTPTKPVPFSGRATPSWKPPGGAGAGSRLDKRTTTTTVKPTTVKGAQQTSDENDLSLHEKRPTNGMGNPQRGRQNLDTVKKKEDDDYSGEILLHTTDASYKQDISNENYNAQGNSNHGMVKGDVAERRLLRDGENPSDKICWETMIGQEIVKLVTMDLIVTILSILVIDFVRGLWIKYCSSWWCWDIETTFPEYGEFKVAENVLHIINNQGMIWLGLFFAPLLPFLNNIKLIIVLYLRGWACMTCNVPAREIFRASRSSNFYLTILLLWLLMCTLPVGYVIGSRKPSKHCGPFAGRDWFYTVVTDVINRHIDSNILGYARHIASPGVIIPIIIFLVLIIYFLTSLVTGLRAANTDLQQQLIHERTEEKKKIFELAGGGSKKKQMPDLSSREKDKKKTQLPQHLTNIEEKRRQPWRQYNGRDVDESLIISDSESDTEIEELESAEPSTRPLPSAVLSGTTETMPAGPQYHHSLGSLAEQSSENTPPKDLRETSRPPSSSAERSKPWRDSPSNTSFEVHSNVVEAVTPEEISTLSQSGAIKLARIDEPQRVPTHRVLSHIPDEDSDKSTTPQHKMSASAYAQSYGIPSIDDGDPTPMPMAISAENKRFEPTNTVPEFQPWPSIDEVKERRRQMRPLPVGRPPVGRQSSSPEKIHHSPTRRASRSTAEPDSHDETRRSASPTRRFRISVSPTRKVESDSESVNTSRRRYVIKQERIADSASTSATTIPAHRQSHDLEAQVHAPVGGRAPLANIEDDSPRSPLS